MSALLPVRNIHVYTHDSIGLGEDGPTHQPVEHVASLRLIPDLQVWRPCDSVESAVAWKCAIENSGGPSALIFTRQGLPHQPRTEAQLENVARGGYVLREAEGNADALIIATGSEVGLAVAAANELSSQGIGSERNIDAQSGALSATGCRVPPVSVAGVIDGPGRCRSRR